ncbi:hypothetical protein D3C80_1151400 [compost metagenome]
MRVWVAGQVHEFYGYAWDNPDKCRRRRNPSGWQRYAKVIKLGIIKWHSRRIATVQLIQLESFNNYIGGRTHAQASTGCIFSRIWKRVELIIILTPIRTQDKAPTIVEEIPPPYHRPVLLGGRYQFNHICFPRGQNVILRKIIA